MAVTEQNPQKGSLASANGSLTTAAVSLFSYVFLLCLLAEKL